MLDQNRGYILGEADRIAFGFGVRRGVLAGSCFRSFVHLSQFGEYFAPGKQRSQLRTLDGEHFGGSRKFFVKTLPFGDVCLWSGGNQVDEIRVANLDVLGALPEVLLLEQLLGPLDRSTDRVDVGRRLEFLSACELQAWQAGPESQKQYPLSES